MPADLVKNVCFPLIDQKVQKILFAIKFIRMQLLKDALLKDLL